MKLSKYEFDRFEMFLTEEPGWNNGEGVPTTRKHVRSALRVMELIQTAGLPGPSLCMGSCGELALIYQTRETDTYITLEIFGRRYYDVIVIRGENFEDCRYGCYPLDVLPEFVIDAIKRVTSENAQAK